MNKYKLFFLYSIIFMVAYSVFGNNVYASAYVKEAGLEAVTIGNDRQDGHYYTVASTLGQPGLSSATDSEYMNTPTYRCYPGYIANLNSRIITAYTFKIKDTGVDKDNNEYTQVAGVYFPLSVIAYDGYGQVAKSDSGTTLSLETSSSTLKIDATGDGNFNQNNVTLNKGQWPGNETLSPQDNFNDAFRAYDTIASSNIWIKSQDDRNREVSVSPLAIQPAWINNYTITATSPQQSSMRWAEKIFAWDVYGNQANSWENLNNSAGQEHSTPQITIRLEPNSAAAHSDMSMIPFKLYEGLESIAGTPERAYTLSLDGKAFVYPCDEIGGSVMLEGEGIIYEYSRLSQSVSQTATKKVTSGTIAVIPSSWEVGVSFVYDYDIKSFEIFTWLEKGADLVLSSLGEAKAYVYSSQGELIKTLAGSLMSPELSEHEHIFMFSWPEANFNEYTYRVKATIEYAGELRENTVNFNIDLARLLEKSLKEEIMEESTELEATFKKVGAETTEKLKEEHTNSIKSDLSKFLVAGAKTIPEQLSTVREELTSYLQAKIFNTPTIMLQGSTYMVSFQTYSGVVPVLDFYNSDGELLIVKEEMTEVENSGVYQVNIELDGSWPEGNYMLVCSEPTHGTLDAISLVLTGTDLTQLDKDISSVVGSTSSLSSLSGLSEEIETAFDAIQVDIEKMFQSVAENIKQTMVDSLGGINFSGVQEATDRIYEGIEGIKKKFGDAGLVPQGLLENIVSLDESRKNDVQYLREKFGQIEVIFRLHQQVLDNYTNKPVTEIWYEFR